MTGPPGESDARSPSGPRAAVPGKALPDAGEGDVQDQHDPGGAPEPEPVSSVPSGQLDSADRPEADVLEQAVVVEVDQSVEPRPWHDDVAEADWLDQSIEEPLDDERR